MGDIWIRDIEITVLIVACALCVVLPIQLLLCFKVKNLFCKLLPSVVLAAFVVFFFVKMRLSTDWTAIGFVILGISFAVLLLFSGIGWGIWAGVKLVKK